MNFTIHDPTGKILRTGFCPVGMEHVQAQEGESMVPQPADLHLDHVIDGAVTKRPANPATLSGMTIANIPKGAVLTINGVDYPVDDGEAELAFTHPGSYTVTVNAFPYLPASFEVTK